MNSLYIIWADIHNTDIPIIDEQHRCLVGIINTLFYFKHDHRAPEVITPIVSMLEKYSQIHFRTEEYILQQAEFPHIKEHKKLHDDFRAKVRIMSLKSRQTLEPDELLFYLKDWWIKHINDADRAYSSYVRDLPYIFGRGYGRDIINN